jgi:hypothetical protein
MALKKLNKKYFRLIYDIYNLKIAGWASKYFEIGEQL